MLTHMQDKKDIQAGLGWLAEQGGGEYSEAVRGYFAHYGLDYPDVEHRFGWFESGGMRLAGQVWKQVKGQKEKGKIQRTQEHKNPRIQEETTGEKSLVVVLHGYMNHTGQMRHLIAGLLDAGFAVGAFDLPGHGLSEGKQAAVGDFSDYTKALLDFVSAAKSMGFGRPHFVGFSTGCTVGIDCLIDGRDVFERVVLVSPLVRWQGYQASKITYSLYRPFTDRIKRVPQRNSSDAEFLHFNRYEDTLHCRTVSLSWVRAMFAWNEKVVRARPCEKTVTILQGDRDTTVDWRYNVRLLRDKFPAANVEMIPGARHELLNEAAELRAKVIGRIVEELIIDN